jgi:hypothetical protein
VEAEEEAELGRERGGRAVSCKKKSSTGKTYHFGLPEVVDQKIQQ